MLSFEAAIAFLAQKGFMYASDVKLIVLGNAEYYLFTRLNNPCQMLAPHIQPP